MSGSEALDYIRAVAAVSTSITVIEHIVEGEDVATLVQQQLEAGPVPMFTRFRIKDGRIADIRNFYDPRPLIGGGA